MECTQSDKTKQPVWRENAVNGRPAVRFDGADDNLRTAYYRSLMFTTHHVTIFAIFRPEGAVEDRGLVGQVFNTLSTRAANGGTLAYYGPNWASLNTVLPGAVRANQWNLAEFVRSGAKPGEAQLFVNGARSDNGTAIAYHNVNSEYGFIGCEHRQSNCWKGDIAEIIIYGDALSAVDRRAVEDYLARKYGMAVAGAPATMPVSSTDSARAPDRR